MVGEQCYMGTMDPACEPNDHPEPSHNHDFHGVVFEDRLQRGIVAGISAIICVGGILGNTMTILAVILSKKLKSFTYAFVANLAVADLLSSILVGFYVENLLWNDDERLPLPCSLCKAVGVLAFIAFSSAVVNIAMISFNRYYRITKPLNKYVRLFNKNRLLLMMVVPWFYSTLSPLLGESIGDTTFGFNHKYRICLIHFMGGHVGPLTFVRIFLIDVTCIIVMLYCYASIFCHIKRQNSKLLKLFPPNTVRVKDGDNDQELNHRPAVMKNESDERIETKNISVTEETERRRRCIDGVIEEYATVTMEITETYKICKTLQTVISVEECSQQEKTAPAEDTQPSSSSATSREVINAGDGTGKHTFKVNAVEDVELEEQSTDDETESLREFDSAYGQPDDGQGNFHSEEEVNEEHGEKDRYRVRSKRYNKRTTNRGRKIMRITVSRRQTALTKNLALVGCTFLACTIPYVACVGVKALQDYLPYFTVLYISKACINPMIYAFKDPRFRKAYCHILRLQFNNII